MEDMTQQEREEAGMGAEPGKVSRRSEKLGKAFQNWRRALLQKLGDMQKKKELFMQWRSACRRGQLSVVYPSCMEDLLWTEDNMDHFLHEFASFDTHKRLWLEKKRRGK